MFNGLLHRFSVFVIACRSLAHHEADVSTSIYVIFVATQDFIVH